MPNQLKVTLYQPEELMVFLRPPEGVKVSGMTGPVMNGPIGDLVLTFTVEYGAEFASSVSSSLLTAWIIERFRRHKAKRASINGREPVDEADFHRIVREELEIGKDD